MNRKRVHKEWQLTAMDIIREWLIIAATPPMSKQFALTSASIASASDNVVAPRNKGKFVVEDVAHFLSHVDTICVHVSLAHAEGQVCADAIIKRISSRHEPFIF